MKLRDRAFLRAKKSGSEAHYEYYKSLRNTTTQTIRREKKAYLNHKFLNKNPKELWSELSKFNIGRKRSSELPVGLRNPEEINNHFIDSVDSLVRSVKGDNSALNDFYQSNVVSEIESRFSFHFVTEHKISNILQSIKTNAVGVDEISIKMIRMCFPAIISPITHIVNECLRLSIFPSVWKIAKIYPLNKVQPPSSFGDLRPLSILPVLSKVLERVMVEQLNNHVENNNILPKYQSGFRAGYSCSTALLNIVDDILCAHDKNMVTAVVLLDFSKAFDTINHQLLFSKLHYIGLSDNAIKMFRSCFEDRFQCVEVDNSCSNLLRITHGVAQGSILGPLLYSIYTCDLLKSLKHCRYHLYADDTQLYYSFNLADVSAANALINEDLKSLTSISNNHQLKINLKKSSFLVFGPHEAATYVRNNLNININNDSLSPVESARNLGLIIDSNLNFDAHVKKLLQSSYFKLKLLYGNRHIFSPEIKKLLCNSLVLSGLSYCYPVYGSCISGFWKQKIQVLQNSCLRFIYSIRRRQHVSHALEIANWLNMNNRYIYQTASLIHKIITTKKPCYLHRKITYRTDVHNLNLRRKNVVSCPHHRLQLFKHSFTYSVYKIYNSIPDCIKALNINAFKAKLKTFLLNVQFQH